MVEDIDFKIVYPNIPIQKYLIFGERIRLALESAEVCKAGELLTIFLGNCSDSLSQSIHSELSDTEYGIFCEGNKIVLAGFLAAGIERDCQRFIDDISNVAKDAEKFYPDGFVFREKYYLWEPTLPAPEFISKIGVYNCGDDKYSLCYRAVKGAFEKYIKALTDASFLVVAQNAVNFNTLCVLERDGLTVYVNYHPRRCVLNISVTTRAYSLPSYTCEKEVCGYVLAQVWVKIGMGYVIRLRDGSFIIIDSGHTIDSERIIETLNQLDVLKKAKFKITAWIITHAHVDHYNGILMLAEKYSDQFDVRQFIYNIPDDSETVGYQVLDKRFNHVFPKALEQFGNPSVYKPHTGEKFDLDDIHIEVLYTHEDMFSEYLNEMNDTSTVLMMTIKSNKILFAGDIYSRGADILVSYYENNLKCDYLQVPHHGYQNGGNAIFYKYCAPKVAMIPMSGTVQGKSSINKTIGDLDVAGCRNILVTNQDIVKNILIELD